MIAPGPPTRRHTWGVHQGCPDHSTSPNRLDTEKEPAPAPILWSPGPGRGSGVGAGSTNPNQTAALSRKLPPCPKNAEHSLDVHSGAESNSSARESDWWAPRGVSSCAGLLSPNRHCEFLARQGRLARPGPSKCYPVPELPFAWATIGEAKAVITTMALNI